MGMEGEGRGNVKNTTNYGARISINCEQAAELWSRLSLQTPTLVSLLTCQVVVSLQSPVYSLQRRSIARSISGLLILGLSALRPDKQAAKNQIPAHIYVKIHQSLCHRS